MTDGTAARLVAENTAIIEDFPKPGITFRDLTPVFADGPSLRAVTDALVEPFAGRIDAVAGVEARGFLLAAASAYALDLGVLVIRKPGKLPREVISESYDLEYGSTSLEVQPSDFPPGTRILLLDDVLATGGTLAAASRLIERAGWVVAGVSVVLELEELDGRANLEGRDIRSLSVV
ncbi:adenine phosphoribosyltransferase [Conyzicola lurida]|jgi:adenine phosphoribosyltransferase|uniref:Adenine phosphoribosyltransferase n=1 Tax=Conyzicola lurida TaxID=1172621 RepID=A0A841AK09_9MICO|nr:adenine phosphoribosyltransferase [Conyzicola lurida]MBB5842292.1 adenine phosphoribosyltransferase [Conyzicola lurida]